jgi:hypothetical protein
MTPEELGPELIRLSGRGELTRGKGADLVAQATEAETRRRRLVELARCATATATAASIAARDRLMPQVSDEMVIESIRTLQTAIEQCQFEILNSESNTDASKPGANSPP